MYITLTADEVKRALLLLIQDKVKINSEKAQFEMLTFDGGELPMADFLTGVRVNLD